MDGGAPSGATQAEELGQPADRLGCLLVVEVLSHEPEHPVAEDLQVGIAIAIDALVDLRRPPKPMMVEEAEEGALELRLRVGLFARDEQATEPPSAPPAGPLPGRGERPGVELPQPV